MGPLGTVATVVAAVGCGMMAGIFFAFSVFLMAAFDRLSPSSAVAAMQAINRTIITPLFLVLFLGAGVACVVALVAALLDPDPDAASRVLVVGAAASYVVGVLVVTGTANVPRNDRLDAVDPAHPDAGERWAEYRRTWTAWNHVRTIASVATTVLLVVAVV